MTGARSAIVILALALAVAGCGRKGALEPPPGAPTASTTAPQGTEPVATPSASLQRPGTSDQSGPLLEDVVRPDRPFLLDFLL